MSLKRNVFSELDKLRKEIFKLLQEFEYQQLKEALGAYNQMIKQVFHNLSTDSLSDHEISMLKQLLVGHKQMLKDVEIQKKAVYTELRQLRNGRTMQQTYPQQ